MTYKILCYRKFKINWHTLPLNNSWRLIIIRKTLFLKISKRQK